MKKGSLIEKRFMQRGVLECSCSAASRLGCGCDVCDWYTRSTALQLQRAASGSKFTNNQSHQSRDSKSQERQTVSRKEHGRGNNKSEGYFLQQCTFIACHMRESICSTYWSVKVVSFYFIPTHLQHWMRSAKAPSRPHAYTSVCKSWRDSLCSDRLPAASQSPSDPRLAAPASAPLLTPTRPRQERPAGISAGLCVPGSLFG